MSTQQTQQFTPAQVLDAGRRAENEGRIPLAEQFYRHLTTTYPDSAEGNAAHIALSRLGSPPTLDPAPPPAHSNGYGLANPFDAVPANGYPAASYDHHHAASDSHAPVPQPIAIEVPPTVGDYKLGRFLARLLTWAGGLVLLAGIGLVPLTILGPRNLAGLPLIGPIIAAGPKAAAQFAAAGILQIVLGQLVRALFDLANATRDMAAITRAQAEANQPEPSAKKSRRRRR